MTMQGNNENDSCKILTRKKHCQIKLQPSKKTNMDIWVVDTSNELFIRGSYTETKFSKNKVVTGKLRSLRQVNFVLIILFVLTLAPDVAVLYENHAFSILVLSTKNLYSSFLKKVFLFQKISFKVKLLKTFNISTDLSNGGLF